MTGVASGATRAALTQHFALHNNAADISAKEGSQETLATMIGMALGMLLARVTIGHPLAIWLSFLSLTMFHMYANYKAVRCLSLTTLNCERSSILLLHFMKTGGQEQVSDMEHVLPLWTTSWISKIPKFLHTRVHIAKYLLFEQKGTVSIVMHKDSTAANVLEAFLHALVMENLDGKDRSSHLESHSWMDKHYENFILKLQSLGWKTERLLSASIIWKANWRLGPLNEKID
ncbi:unnamed protein product [Camellia sinensis]